jgi:hypothetical protein
MLEYQAQKVVIVLQPPSIPSQNLHFALEQVNSELCRLQYKSH